MIRNNTFLYICLLVCLAFVVTTVHAQYFSSSNYEIETSTFAAGGRSTSSSFILNSAITQISNGTSTSLNNVIRAGFLYWPEVTTPVVVATAGEEKVSLSWTTAVPTLGWNVTSYTIGQSTTSGGPYSYTNVGNILSSERTGLSGGTTYYFVVLANDTFGNPIATSTEAFATPTSGGGGGGGGSIPSGDSRVVFSGWAYPSSVVTLLQDSKIVKTKVANGNTQFEIELDDVESGSFNFSLYTQDTKGYRSNLASYSIKLKSGETSRVSGIFLSPTITTDKSEVKRGENITISGQTIPRAGVTITINPNRVYVFNSIADEDGLYFYQLDSDLLEYGNYTVTSKSNYSNMISPASQAAAFKVGDITKYNETRPCPQKADVNNDCRVNLVDFSITAFWYKRPISQAFKEIEMVKLSEDGMITLTDFSIMAFYWTG